MFGIWSKTQKKFDFKVMNAFWKATFARRLRYSFDVIQTKLFLYIRCAAIYKTRTNLEHGVVAVCTAKPAAAGDAVPRPALHFPLLSLPKCARKRENIFFQLISPPECLRWAFGRRKRLKTDSFSRPRQVIYLRFGRHARDKQQFSRSIKPYTFTIYVCVCKEHTKWKWIGNFF